MDLAALLAPRSVAIIGASANPGGHAGRCLGNLVRTGYEGRIFPVNPKYGEIAGHRTFASVLDIEEDVEAAYILLPAAKVANAVAQCAQRGIRTAIVCTSGFGELGGEAEQEQRRLVDLAREAGLRLLGPNCIGVLNVVDRYVGCPTTNITYEHVPGDITILSHSGGMGTILFNRAQGRGIGIRAMVSLGNEADLEMAEMVDAFVDDEATRVFALFVEQLRDGAAFVAAAERARAAGKPIVALDTGRSEAGRRSAFGHTGALASDHAVFSSVMRQLGVLVVGSADELVDAAHLLASLPAPTGNRLGVLSPSGGESSYVADRAAAAGLALPLLSDATFALLSEKLALTTPGNPLDATGQVIGDRRLLEEVLADFSGDDAFDMVLYTIPSWGEQDNTDLLPAFLDAAGRSLRPTVVAQWQARTLTEEGDAALRAAGVPSFTSPDAAVIALAGLQRYWSATVRRRADAPQPIALPVPSGAGELSERDAKALLAAAGLPVAEEELVAKADEVADVATRLGGEVVVKLLARGVVHKADLGLVRLGLRSAEEAAAAAADLTEVAQAHDLDVEGYLVARHVEGAEVIVGGLQDPTFGPLILIGAGGILAEHLDDIAFLLAPVAIEEAREAIASLRVHDVLAGARSRHHDVDGLASFVSRFSRVLAGSQWISEVDVNPVIVRRDGGGVAAVDASIRIAKD